MEAKSMNTDTAAILSFLEGICRDSDTQTAAFWRGYWLETGHVKRLLQMIERLEPFLKNKPAILDIGSFGELPLILRKFYGLSAVHANSYEGNFISFGEGKLLAKEDPKTEIAFVIDQCDVEHMPMRQADGSLDIVTCFEMLEHLRHDPMFMMLDIHRVLRPDGLLILTTPNASSWDSFARVAEFESPFMFSSYFANGSGIGHCKEYSVSEITRLIENAGFTLETLETFDPLPSSWELAKGMKELKAFAASRPWWKEELRGQNFYIRARKTGMPKMRKYVPLYTEDIPYFEQKKIPVDADFTELKPLLEAGAGQVHDLEMKITALVERNRHLETELEERGQRSMRLNQEVTELRQVVNSRRLLLKQLWQRSWR
jgi:SAM-dependent methyltransferase